jgi:hypothetical protein
LSIVQGLPTGARAWGLSVDLNNGWLDSQLVTHVIQSKAITYCVDIQDSRFALGTLERQVEMALSLWLKPLESLGIQGVAIRAVSCSDPSFNLKIQLAHESQYTDIGSYQTPQREGSHAYSLVKVDSDFRYVADGKTYEIVDFENFVPAGRSLGSLLGYISVVQPMTAQQFTDFLGGDYYAVFWSTYRLLIHETGHSFGLCDTYDSQVQKRCDPAFRTPTQPSSVMKDSNYFYLTDDDVAGIQALFRRYQK